MILKKYNRRISILIVVLTTLAFISSTVSYSASTDEGYKDGYSEGWLDGIEKAEEDMSRNRSKNYLREMPSNDEIIKMYNLKNESTRYKNSFIDGYEDGFKEGYNITYKKSNENDKDNEKNRGTTYAESLGTAVGEAYGQRDYYNGKPNRWSSSAPSNSNIVDSFDLKKETNEYRTTFIDAFNKSFKEGYEEGYRKAKFEPFEASFEQGSKDGEHFGRLLGDIYGKKDFFSGKSSDWERNLPSRARIISDFSLNHDNKEYLEAFVSSFNYAFEEKYNDSFRSSNSKVNDITYENGYKHGVETGLKRGEGFAQMDFFLGQSNNIIRHKPYDLEIINEFNLYLETEKYREGFISGFNEGLTEGYIKTYQDINHNSSLTKVETKIIPISGGEISTSDKRVAIKITKGTYYNDVTISLDGLSSSYLSSKEKLIKASDIYTVKVSNLSYQFDNSKQIELNFEYYGTQNGGIYKYTNNNWVYLPSKISDNKITTYVRPSSLNYNSGIYAVFVDNSVKTIKDIRGHWAKDEINTYVRRGLVGLYADNTFRPNSPISRGELLVLLNSVYGWNLNGLDTNIKELEKLRDYESLGGYKSLVAYALKQGYMDIYSDNTFNLYNKVSYKQMESIMRKLTGDNSFYWANVSSNMIKYKDTRSKSNDSMDNTITRAEAVYMIFLLNEWKY